MKRLLMATCLVAAGAFLRGHATQAASSGPICRLTDLGTLGGSISGVSSINNAGVVVGNSNLRGDTVAHEFIRS